MNEQCHLVLNVTQVISAFRSSVVDKSEYQLGWGNACYCGCFILAYHTVAAEMLFHQHTSCQNLKKIKKTRLVCILGAFWIS